MRTTITPHEHGNHASSEWQSRRDREQSPSPLPRQTATNDSAETGKDEPARAGPHAASAFPMAPPPDVETTEHVPTLAEMSDAEVNVNSFHYLSLHAC